MKLSSRTNVTRLLFLLTAVTIIGLFSLSYLYSQNSRSSGPDAAVAADSELFPLTDRIGFSTDPDIPGSACGITLAYSPDQDNTENVESNGEWWVFLSHECPGGIALVCDENIEVRIGNNSFFNGSRIPSEIILSDTAQSASIIDAQGNEEHGHFRFYTAEGLPSVHLGTANGDLEDLAVEKGTELDGFVTIVDEEGSEDTASLCSVRIHGNTSFFSTKKSFQFTLPAEQSFLGMPALWNRFVYLQMTRQFHPVTIVEYERTAYIWKPDNVRITLDCQLSSSRDFSCFYDRKIAARPVMPAGRQLLEVKFDHLLPDSIRHTLALKDMQMTAYSKYILCRRYSL